VSEDLRAALGSIIESGYQLSADGFEFLGTLTGDSLKDTVKQALKSASSSAKDITIIDRSFLENVFSEGKEEPTPRRTSAGKPSIRPLASEYEGQIQILEDSPAEPSGDLAGFVEHFRSRFRALEGILRKRIDMRDAVTIGMALNMPLKAKMKVIGFISNKRVSGTRVFIDLEDNEDSITVMASDGETMRKGLTILEDQVICVDAVKYKPDLLIAKDFIWPDIPGRNPRRSEQPLCAALLSDVHVGSVHFQKELFGRFIQWMNMEVGPPQSRALAARVKYVVVAGDLVDGIGVYPNQMDELEITDIWEQYEAAALMLSELPDYVEVIVLPGNHDAVRRSLPQPPISQQYAELLDDDGRIHLLGNPCHLLINGVEAYISHGKALDDILSKIPGMGFQNPLAGMELLLRCRHVAPTYGSSTPIAPEKVDRLVIPSAPDIFQMGHIHIYGKRRYKGTTIVASGSWQAQTPFQKRVNLTPTVGVAPIMDLQTHQVIDLDIKRLG